MYCKDRGPNVSLIIPNQYQLVHRMLLTVEKLRTYMHIYLRGRQKLLRGGVAMAIEGSQWPRKFLKLFFSREKAVLVASRLPHRNSGSNRTKRLG